MWITIFMFLTFAILGNIAIGEDGDEATVETVIVETTTQLVYVHTDLAETDVDAAMNLDVGNYTTMRFNYINSQFDKLKKKEKCYDDYIKCMLSQVAMTPVCAYNTFYDSPRSEGFKTANSYCDIYFDNCRRTVRFWRILDYGKCDELELGIYYNLQIPNTLRKLFKSYTKKV